MDGLECSEVLCSDLLIDNPTLRFDSEFYRKYYVRVSQIIAMQHTKKLGAITSLITQGPNPVFSPDGKIPCLTGRNIAGGRVNYSDPDYIDDREYTDLKRFQLIPGDTLITLKGKGSIGKIGYVVERRKAIFSRNIGVIRPSTIEPALVNAYLMSKCGHELVLRGETGGTGQTTLTTAHLKLMDIPILNLLQPQIKRLLDESEKVRLESNKEYLDAEQLLLSTLGMTDFTPSEQSISIKSLSDSFAASKRLDAEYYQPKYNDYAKLLKTADTVLTLCNVHDKNFTPKSGMEYKYIELANVGSFGNINDVEVIFGEDLPSRARREVKTGQVIVSSVEGSMQSCALITEEYNNAICSTGFYVLDSNSINSETLLILFKSEPIQALLKQRCSGTILTAITKDELLSMPLPQIDEAIQKQIASKVQESFALRHQSEQLLEDAKLAVEIAIEQGEDEAIDWLKERLMANAKL